MEYKKPVQRYNQALQGSLTKLKLKRLDRGPGYIFYGYKGSNFKSCQGFWCIVSDEELAQNIAEIQAFHNSNGVFDRDIYRNFLKNSGIKLKTFEKSMRGDLTIEKTLSLLNLDALREEVEAIYLTSNIADKLKYRVISKDDINISIDEDKLKKFWEERRDNFKNPKNMSLILYGLIQKI